MEISVYVEHRCAAFAFGRAYPRSGPDLTWKACPDLTSGAWHVTLLDMTGPMSRRRSLSSAVYAAIVDELGETSLARLRRLQDERAEAPE